MTGQQLAMEVNRVIVFEEPECLDLKLLIALGSRVRVPHCGIYFASIIMIFFFFFEKNKEEQVS